jgi:hypothetical protein
MFYKQYFESGVVIWALWAFGVFLSWHLHSMLAVCLGFGFIGVVCTLFALLLVSTR